MELWSSASTLRCFGIRVGDGTREKGKASKVVGGQALHMTFTRAGNTMVFTMQNYPT
jgi:hypothetical protein